MAFKHYLEEEDDKPYFTTNSLGYYYDKMEGFAEKVEQAAKTLNVTKEEIEQRIALRLAEWDKNLESFDGSVEKLLTEWVDDGTLTHVIDSTLIDQKIAPVTAQLNEKASKKEIANIVVDVKTFGAVGDGITNDTQSFKNAINSAALFPESTLFVPGSIGDYLINETLYIPHTLNVKMDGRILFDPLTEVPGIVIGHPSNVVLNKQIQIRIKRNKVSTWLDEKSIGVKIINSDTCKIYLNEAIGFTIGAQYMGSGKGFAYNETSVGYFVNNKTQIELTNENNGWCNENIFIGGRLTNHSTTKLGESRYGVKITSKDGGYVTNNNNMFIKPCFELQVPTTGEAVPVLIEHGNQNTFDKIRNESNSPTTIRTLNDSSENEITTGYGPVVIEDLGRYPSTYGVSTRNKLMDNGQNVIFNSGAMHKTACYYDGSDRVNIPNVHLTATTDVRTDLSLITINDKYIEFPSSRAVGVFVDTSTTKQFVIRRDVEVNNGGRIMIRCYDANGNILNALNPGHPFVKSNPVRTPSYTGENVYGGAYRTGIDSNSEWYVKLADNVHRIAVLLTGGTAPLRIRSFTISSLGIASPTVWSGIDSFLTKNNIATSPPSIGTWERGKTIYNAVPAIGSPKGWRKVTEGSSNILGVDWEVI